MSSSPQSHVDTTDIHDRARRRPLALACAAALGMMAGVLLSPPVLAAVTTSQGGAGGNNGATHGGSGGAGNGSGGQGGDGDVGLPADGGDGGAGGHGSSPISAGGAGGSVGATTVGGSSVTGGNGVIGETDPALVYTSGGGGGGGAGVYTLDTSINLATGLTLTGGQGGDGGVNNPIAGGGGGGGAGLVVLSGTASINIDGNIVGGAGGDGASGQFGGGGGGGGDGIVLVGGAGVLTNTGSIVGGAGGQAGDGTYYAGSHGGGGAGVNLGSDGNTVINSGTIVGGSAIGLPLSGGASGAGMIAGNGTQVTNQVGGSIIGGEASGTGSVGGHGIVATTSGAQSVIIDNHGSIVGGAGGRSLGGSAPSGTGGQAITASGNVSITNGGMIAGGHGGGIGGGRGGIGIDIVVADGEQATITNLGGAVIQGGYGGDLSSGNFGGAGIRADGNVTIVNQAGASILGDEGGLSDISTTGGTAIGADNGVSIDNSGLIAGTGGLGARSAINAHEASIVNRAGGSIIGGNGQGDSAGAVAISSSGGTRIDNAGSIVGGHVDNSGAQANAVLLAGGGNTLQLLAGSSITGNVLSISGSGAGGDSFILGGDVDAPGGNAFDVGGVSGFASYRKSGTSRWTLTGTGSTGQVWTIDAGSLVADAHSLVTDVTDNATLVFDQAVDGIYAGIVSGSGNLVKQGTGALTLIDTSRYTGGTTITAGTLQIGNGGTTGSIIGNVANAGTLAFDRSDDVAFDGVVSGTGSLVQQGEGSLVLTGANSYTGGTTIADGTLQIGKGGTTGSIVGDVANNGVLVFDRSDAMTFAGGVSGSGSLVQQGSGVLTLDGDSGAFTGDTELRSGSLVVGGTAGNGAVLGGDVQVDAAATLAGHGRIGGDVEVRSGAHLSAGSATAAIGDLDIGGNLALSAGSHVDVDLGTPLADFQPFGASDHVTVAGDLTLAGVTVDVADAGGLGAGLYNVIRWDGSLSGGESDIALGKVPAGSRLSLQLLSAQRQLNLIDTQGFTLNVWNANGKADATRMGGGGGTWSTTSPAWTDTKGTTPNAAMVPQPGFAVFGGDAGTVTIDGGDGDVSATGMQFAVDGYRLTGDALTLMKNADGDAPIIRVGDGSADGASTRVGIDAVLAGSDGLVKTDQGTLVLDATNTFSGGVTVNGGTLSVADDGNLGDASNGLTLDGGVLEVTGTGFNTTARDIVLGDHGGGFAIDAADATFTVASSLDGKGALAKRGAGTLTLTGANSYTGGTTITDGTLQVGKGGMTGSIVGDVANAGTLVFDRSDDVAFAGKVSGSGSLVQQGEGTLALTSDSNYTGGTTIADGTLQIGNGGTTGSIIGDVANAGTLVFDRSNDVAFAGVVSGTGSLVQQGEGSLVLTGDSNYTGGTTITGRTLQIGNGGTTGSIIGDVANAGTLAFDRSNDVAFAGVVAGSGSLVQQGEGSLVLTGANSYTGGTAITDGTLQIGNGGTTGSIVGDVANDGVLAFDRSDDVAFTGKVSGTGSLVQQGAGTLTLTGANSYTGGTTITAGTLLGDTTSLQGDIANEAVLRFEQQADGRYAGVLSGGGVLDKRGVGTLALGGDSHAFAGSTRVRAGGLAVDGKLGGNLVMDAGTRLSGTGTLGNLDLAGTLAPGHSIGTLTASGDVVIHDGASYEVETDASGHSDRLAVAGRATLQGGSVLNLARDGAYATQTTYTILTADGGVSGTFGGVTSSLAFLDPTLIYDAHAVQLTLVRNQVDFCAVATTANQCATGQAIQNQGDGPLHEALVTQDAEHARAAMAQWSGESLASTRTALLRDSRFVRDAMSERLHRADSARDDARALGSSAGAIWTHGWEHTGRADGDGNASQARSSGHGLLLGVDAPLGDHLRAGITGGQGQDNTRVEALHDTARVKSRHLGLYAGSRWGAWQLDAGLAQSWHRIDSTRNIDAVLPATVHADYHGRSRQAQLEGSYRFALRRGSVQPFVNLAYVAAHTDALDEHGGVTALHSDSETSEAGFGTLGVRGLWTLAGAGTETSAIYGTLGWRHTFGDRVPLAQQHFADGERFTVSGAPLAANAAVLQLGIDAALSGRARLRAGYDGVLADDGKDHAVKLTLQVAL